MGLQIAAAARDMIIKMGVTPQIGMNMEVNQTQLLRGEAPKQQKQVSIKHEAIASVPLAPLLL